MIIEISNNAADININGKPVHNATYEEISSLLRSLKPLIEKIKGNNDLEIQEIEWSMGVLSYINE